MSVIPIVHPKFSEPPLVEQAIVVAFDAVQGFDLSDYGLFWNEIRAEFPQTETASRLETAVEKLGQDNRCSVRCVRRPHHDQPQQPAASVGFA